MIGATFFPQGFAHRTWPILSLLLAVAGVAGLILAITPFPRRVLISGKLQPSSGTLAVTARQTGVVLRAFVHEGQEVRARQPLFQIELDTPLSGGQLAGALISAADEDRDRAAKQQRAARLAIYDQKVRDLEVRDTALKGQLSILVDAVALDARRVKLAQDRLKRAQPLVDQGFASQIQLQSWQDDVLQTQIALSGAQRELAEAQRSAAQIKVEREAIQAERASTLADADAVIAQGRQQSIQTLSQREVVVSAPQDGRIAAIQAFSGSFVASNQQMALLLPRQGSLEAVLDVPSSAIAFLEKGEAVRLMYDAFPHQIFGFARGRVREISGAPIVSASGQSTYPLRVDLERQTMSADGRQMALLPGMQVQAYVALEERSFLQWLLGWRLRNV